MALTLTKLTDAEAYELNKMNQHFNKYSLGSRIQDLENYVEDLDSDAEVTDSLLTGFSSGAGTVSAADTILQGFNKLVGNTQNLAVIANVLTGFSSGAGTVSSSDTILGALQKLTGNTQNLAVINNVLTGYSAAAGTVSSSDSILAAIQKVDGNNLAITNNTVTLVGAKADPASGTNTCTIERFGKFFVLTFTLADARISVTDGAGSGSHGALKLFDFVEGSIAFLGCRQNYTAFAEGAALTTGAGDAVFEIGVGTTAISAAADGTLASANDNVGNDVDVTLSGGTGTGTTHTGAVTAAVDGTATAADLYLNWSGTAATIDASSTIDVTGTITVIGCLLGDD